MKLVEIIAAGKIKKTPYEDLFSVYQKRMHWPCNVHEIESRHTQGSKIREDEWARLSEKINPSAYLVVLDEKGKSMKSADFAALFGNLQTEGRNHIQFILGGADGLSDEMRGRADLLLSFGVQTWPHMLARIMLLEQIYRAQQILAGHPYHRD
ncbi:MAG: 23S rRNA (pseudouridine(1915)-N(3))-methyltransferase RlmH [Alphaproteobacteria bacterium]|nr:23S rRNA (pseudouridine(1915)-N(3))-methyltransferase RlmH [Alphaproteobacteria bacterium]MCD8526043.1 23S rRNA (pseudouridine(1915)-N(3))-methyltransferase RlmH [Alphaproteobacteria bacterium]MCD8570601.1 23S rRNA (pseudouridine(1915)-N(3))-methyltransferase RlmH [Alphaproteobacteria bacterium]